MQKLNRRQFLSLASGGAVAAVTFSFSGCTTELVKSGDLLSKRPNIIFLLTDDQRWDAMGCAGNRIIHTPNMDELAGDGIRFSNAFVTTSICSASRASIFTGLYTRCHGISAFRPDLSESIFEQTYPVLVRQAGYRVGFVGKYGFGSKIPSEVFDFCYGILGQPEYEHTDQDGNFKHMTQIMGEQSIKFLRTCSKDQPFCLSVSFKAPHVQDNDPRQFIYDPVYENLYEDVNIPVPETAANNYFEALPDFLKDSEARKRWQIRFSTPQMYQKSVKGYYRLVTGVDVVIGSIRDELRRLNLDDNTVIILTSDNGFYLGEHGLAGKWFPHEESIRVPLLIFDPRASGKMRGVTLEQMALNVDIAPTILELANQPLPRMMQGRSLVPLMKGRRPKWRADFFYEHLRNRSGIPKSEAVRTKRWKYIRYFEQQPVYEELYDLKNDKFETHNLVSDRRYTRKLKQLRRRCDRLLEHLEGVNFE